MCKPICEITKVPNERMRVLNFNFNVKEHKEVVNDLIEDTNGIEPGLWIGDDPVYWGHRYSFSIEVGTLFDTDEVAKELAGRIMDWYAEFNKLCNNETENN